MVVVPVGDLVSEERFSAVFRVYLPAGDQGRTTTLRFSLTDRDDSVSAAPATCTWTWVGGALSHLQPRDRAVDHVVATRHAARAREQAALANRSQDCAVAAQALERVAKRIADYAAGDPVLERMVLELRADAEVHRRPLVAMDLKDRYFTASSARRGKNVTGGANR